MKRCPHCNDWVALRAVRCIWCSQPLAPEPARTDKAVFVSTDWVGEAEAALTHARNAMMKAPEWMTNYTVQQEIAIAIRCIETALASVPRPSPTEKLTD